MGSMKCIALCTPVLETASWCQPEQTANFGSVIRIKLKMKQDISAHSFSNTAGAAKMNDGSPASHTVPAVARIRHANPSQLLRLIASISTTCASRSMSLFEYQIGTTLCSCCFDTLEPVVVIRYTFSPHQGPRSKQTNTMNYINVMHGQLHRIHTKELRNELLVGSLQSVS